MPEVGIPYTLIGPDGTRAVFNDPDDPDFCGMLDGETGVQGLDGAEIRESFDLIAEGDGGLHGNFYDGRRPVILEGIVVPELEMDGINAKETQIKRASRGKRADCTLLWTPSGSVERRLLLRRQQKPMITGRRPKKFQLALVSADPRIESSAEHEVFLPPNTERNATNIGDLDGSWSARIDGPITNPVLINYTQDEKIKLDRDLALGEYLIVDERTRSIYLGRDYVAKGVESVLTWGVPLSEQDTEMAALADLGVEWIRLTIDWRAMQYGGVADMPVAIDWSPSDSAVPRAHAAGLKIIADIGNVPDWANEDSGHYRPASNPADFAAFCAAFVTRYKGQFDAFEVWNEPNNATFWLPTPSPSQYADLVKATYTAVKAVDPDLPVLAGSFALSDYRFLDLMYAHADANGWNLDDYMDGISTHPYNGAIGAPEIVSLDSRGRVDIGNVPAYRELFQSTRYHGTGAGLQDTFDPPPYPDFDKDTIAGLQLWLRADMTGDEYAGDGDAVGSYLGGWKDWSGNGRHAAQATAGKQPIMKMGIVGGQPVVRFDGSNDSLHSAFTLAQPSTVIVVAAYRGARVTNDTLLDGNTADSMRLFRSAANTVRMDPNTPGPSVSPADVTQFHIYTARFNGASSRLRFDGGAPASGAAVGTAAGGVTLGAKANDTEYGPVDIAEVLVIDHNLTDAERAHVEFYLAKKYGLSTPVIPDPIVWAQLVPDNLATLSGGQLHIPRALSPAYDYPGIKTRGTYSLKDSEVVFDMTTVPLGNSQQIGIALSLDPADWGGALGGIDMYVNHNPSPLLEMHLNHTGSGFDTTSVAWDATAMRYWRIRAAGGTIYWDTSPDRVTWTTRFSHAVEWAITDLYVFVYNGQYAAGNADADLIVSSLNTPARINNGPPLTDDFSLGDVDLHRWSQMETGHPATVVAERLHIPRAVGPDYDYPGLVSRAPYSLRVDSVSLRVASMPLGNSQQIGIALGLTPMDANPGYEMYVNTNPAPLLRLVASGSAATVPWDPVAMAYWRIRYDGANVLFETSPDRATWTVQRTVAPGPLDEVYLSIRNGQYAAGNADQDFIVDDVRGPYQSQVPQPRHGGKRLWFTEWGWATTTAAGGVTQAKQAEYLTRGMALFREDPWIVAATWYLIRNNPFGGDADLWEPQLGLMTVNFTHKLSYAAMQAIVRADALDPLTVADGDLDFLQSAWWRLLADADNRVRLYSYDSAFAGEDAGASFAWRDAWE